MTLTKLSHRPTPSFPFFMDKFFDGNMMGSNINYSDTKSAFPSVNIKETEDDFILEVAAPGLTKEDFKIDFENIWFANVISITSKIGNKPVNC